MADITSIMGGAYSPAPEKRIDPPEIQLRNAMSDAGIEPPDDIRMDGAIHRFKSGTSGKTGAGDKSGWYVAYSDGIPAGRFGCWRADIEVIWRADIGRSLTPFDEINHARRMSEARVARDAEIARTREVAAVTVDAIWSGGAAATLDHPYIQAKGIQVHGARVTGDGRLMLPLYGDDGVLASIQYISASGDKKYHTGGATAGKFKQFGDIGETVYIAEGFATAATIYEVTGACVLAAYSANNLQPIAEMIRARSSTINIIMVADNDESGVGLRKATEAAEAVAGRVIMPPVEGDANDYALNGHDLSALLSPPVNDWLIPADDFCQQPAPIKWMVKGWLQDQALIMVHGPSGGGKTFVVLDWCMRMAGGYGDWMGAKVRDGNVVYLAGEGHHGLRGRVAAWKHHNQCARLNMWLSRDGCDLNTHAGLQRVFDNLDAMPVKPKIIVVDTLHRFLSGDENSSVDTKSMLDACAKVMQRYECSVLLVHHTGVNEEAQHRARGSSAWRGALDIEISIVPAKDGRPMEIVQRKSKDAEMSEPIYAQLESVDIPGWFDEDGAAVNSAVLVAADAPAKKEDGKVSEVFAVFQAAWYSSGADILESSPYVSTSAYSRHVSEVKRVSLKTAQNLCTPSGSMVSVLVDAGVIEARAHGYIVVHSDYANPMNLSRSGDRK